MMKILIDMKKKNIMIFVSHYNFQTVCNKKPNELNKFIKTHRNIMFQDSKKVNTL